MGFQTFSFGGKAPVKGDDIGGGQIELRHLSPSLFLELQLIKLHSHSGVDSIPLTFRATPDMVKGYQSGEREERGTATWTGGASASGSVIITFGNVFSSVPTCLATPSGGDADIQCAVGTIDETTVTIFWKDDTGATHTSVPFDWLAKGRI